MAVDVVTRTTIARPVAEVAAFAADPDSAPRWYASIRSVEWRTPPPLAEGSEIAFVARFLGRRLAYTYEIVENVPGERLTMRTAQGPFPMETTYTWAPSDDGGTTMTLRNRGEPHGFRAVAAPAVAAAMRRANEADLRRLKEILESG
ncbi:SRPBCC family protein [Pseudonocardia halophobica]|uniref:ATPase n=1 Tax=Pseudonocardia halophobica TaxID=29401 RepID=A0A9W6L5N4_9PSEU|nr:SRPBCC family protein [Pseudonocardia halophobica]GLL13410.1 ATPase [Pseudonocardia halophobica]